MKQMRRKRENNMKNHGLIPAIAGAPELFRGGESPSRRENKIVYAVWDSSGCLSRFGEHGKENGLHHYAGGYPIVGRLREGWPNFHIERAGDNRFSFSLPSTTFFIPKGFPDPIIHLDFSLLLPWVLEEDAD